MLRLRMGATLAGLAVGGLLQGCISPLNQLESDVQVERSIRAQWRVPDRPPQEVRASSLDVPNAPLVLTPESPLADYLRYAFEHSPDLDAAFYRWRAALERVEQVKSLPDPRLAYGFFANEVQTRTGPQQHRVSLAQTFPWFGKLDLKGDVAAEAANVEFQRFQGAILQLAWRVKQAYYELYYLRGAVDLTRENVQLLAQFEQIARAKYRVAAASHPDVIRVQVELGKLEDRLRQLEDLRRPLSAQLNAALNRPSDAPVPWPDSIDGPTDALDDDALRSSLRERNPQLEALLHEVEQHRHASALAHKAGLPDITLSVDYLVTDEALDRSIGGSGDDPVIAGVSLNLPLWADKYEAGVREAIKRRLAAASQRSEQENRLLAELERAMYDYRDARRKITLYRDTLIPRQTEALTTAIRSYETASMSFLDLLDLERVLLELQLSQRRADANAAIALAKIEMFIGGRIEQTTNDADNPEDGS